MSGWADDLVSPLRVASVLDPAIDRAASDVADYSETRDPSKLAALPGKAITWATIRPLTVDEFIGIDAAPSAPTKLVLAFRAAVQGVSLPDGVNALRPSQQVPSNGGPDRLMWSSDDLGAVMREWGAEFVYEIGQVIYERARSGKAWGGGVCYTLPQSSLLGLARIARRLAERERQTDGTRSSGASASESPATPSGSDAATAAAATAPTDGAAATP